MTKRRFPDDLLIPNRTFRSEDPPGSCALASRNCQLACASGWSFCARKFTNPGNLSAQSKFESRLSLSRCRGSLAEARVKTFSSGLVYRLLSFLWLDSELRVGGMLEQVLSQAAALGVLSHYRAANHHIDVVPGPLLASDAEPHYFATPTGRLSAWQSFAARTAP